MNRIRLVQCLMAVALVAPSVATGLAIEAGPASAMATVCTALTGGAPYGAPYIFTGCNDTANTGGTGTSYPCSHPCTIVWTEVTPR